MDSPIADELINESLRILGSFVTALPPLAICSFLMWFIGLQLPTVLLTIMVALWLFYLTEEDYVDGLFGFSLEIYQIIVRIAIDVSLYLVSIYLQRFVESLDFHHHHDYFRSIPHGKEVMTGVFNVLLLDMKFAGSLSICRLLIHGLILFIDVTGDMF